MADRNLRAVVWHSGVRDTRIWSVPILMTIVGPIAAGKNTVADLVANRCIETGRTVVVADVDDVAFMLRPRERRGSLWLGAHQAHGALVGTWLVAAFGAQTEPTIDLAAAVARVGFSGTVRRPFVVMPARSPVGQ
jgi:hypothetical protein